MSARAPRRSFLSPFVVTLAAPACFVQSSTPPSQPVSQPSPGQPETTDPRPSPPPPEAQTPTIIANPPRPTDPQPTANPPPPDPPVTTTTPTGPNPNEPDAKWMVSKTSGGCMARAITQCPPKALCNPPPPHSIACVDGVKYPASLTKRGGVCTIDDSRTAPCPK